MKEEPGTGGGKVSIENSGYIITVGKRAHGIVAQSLGGGGGDGGMAVNGLRNSSTGSAKVLVTVGGSGGSGGSGERVTVQNTGVIGTSGEEGVGILAQSIGGGGGRGSTVITGSFTSASDVTTIGIGIGGKGGEGGAGSDVSVSNTEKTGSSNSGLIHTTGKGAHGIMALSIGGGGGTGSTVITATNSFQKGSTPSSNALALTIGGAGGEGGCAGRVTAVNEGRIITEGYEAHGIVAESIGGGGGNGGIAISGNVLIGGTEATGMNSSIAIGGNGGSGNTGDDVLVENNGSIETYGKKSCGIFAQSIGGGGGNGEASVSISMDPTIINGLGSQSALFSIGIGGSGGDGSDAGNVTVTHSGSITVNGEDSYSIFAQSVGGGGGSSNIGFSSPFWMAGDLVFTTLLGVKDPSDGNPGTVTLNTSGTIITKGANSKAVFKQAVSGGGGDLNLYLDISRDASSLYQDAVHIEEVRSATEDLLAKFKGVLGLGSENNNHNQGGSVGGSHLGDIITQGDNSPGMFAQSIGGGGGNGNLSLKPRNQTNLDFRLNFGGKDGQMSPGGPVSLQRSGNITTQGKSSCAVNVQSIGGGGGTLNLSILRTGSQNAGTPNNGTGTVHAVMGGTGGSGLNGGAISLHMSGDLSTDEDPSMGIMAQSIGGGGGLLTLAGEDQAEIVLGGQAGVSGDGGDVDITNSGDITTNGDLSHGIFVQSIGGGGGAIFTGLAPSEIALTLSPHGTGNGGDIIVSQTGNVSASGNSSFGIFIHSLGGGGGVVDDLFAGSAGGSGDAGDIRLDLNGEVSTTGEQGTGIYLQSEAGLGKGGQVTLNLTGDVYTWGDSSPGVDLLSKGSNGAGAVNLTITGDVRTAGNSSEGIRVRTDEGTGSDEDIDVSISGNIVTRGVASDGIKVMAGGAGTHEGNISVTAEGNVTASGEGSAAILVQNSSGTVSNRIHVTLNGQSIIGGTDGEAGVSTLGGGQSQIENSAILVTADGMKGTAVHCTSGDDVINNNGTIMGNILLGTGATEISNNSGAYILSGDTVDMGDRGILTNHGIISPGGNSELQTTNMTGDFNQGADGVYELTLDFNVNQTDLINQKGSADLEGSVQVKTVNPERLLPGKHQAAIMSSTEGIVAQDVELDAQPSAVVNYYLAQPEVSDIDLHFDIDFSPSGLSKNQGSIGEYFNEVQLAGGSSAMDPYIVKLFELPDVPALARVYEPLIPDFYNHFTQTTIKMVSQSRRMVSERIYNLQKAGKIYSSLSPLRARFSNGRPVMIAYNGSNAGMAQLLPRLCPDQKYGIWLNASGLVGNQTERSDFTGYNYDSLGIWGGLDFRFKRQVVAGLALGMSTTDIDVDNNEGEGDIRSFFASLYATWLKKGYYASGIVSYGRHKYSSSRYLNVFSVPTRTTAKHHGNSWAFYGEGGYTFDLSSWALRPYLGVEFTYLSESNYHEDGAGAMSLIMKDRYTKSLSSDLGLRLNRPFKVKSGIITPELSVGWNYDFNIDDRSLTSSFAGFPGASFSTGAPEQPSNGLRAGIGLSFAGHSGISSRLVCDGEWRSGYGAYGIIGELCMRF